MTTTLSRGAPAPDAGRRLPTLLPGDHLDRTTFHVRYQAMPDGVRAELVEGIVYMPPLYLPHAQMHSEVMGWLHLYRLATPGVTVLDSPSVLLADEDEPQPDACVILPAGAGGRTQRDGEVLSGPPEFVVEVAYSSDAYDLHSKRRTYARAGVREYVVMILREERVVWFVLRGARFIERSAARDGLLHSAVLPGLWLDPAALLRRDAVAVRAALDRGLAAPEHARFVGRLQTSVPEG